MRRLAADASVIGFAAPCGPAEHEAIHARVEVAERAQLLAQLVDSLIRPAGHLQPPRGDELRQLHQSRRPGRRTARARSWRCAHSSLASWRAPSTPLNETNVVLRASVRDGLARLGRRAGDVEQIVDDLEREPEVLRVVGERAEIARTTRPR